MARILIVEDNAEMRMMMMALLGSKGHEIIEAIDGTDVLRWAVEEEPDLVLMDVMMPRVDGISLCRSIRANPKTESVKVLAITAFPEQDNVKKMYDAGADLCLIKPLQFEHFRLEVMRLLNEACNRKATAESQG